MPRRRRAEVREVAPDPIFGSTLVEKFVNSLMWEGRKAVAQRVFYAAMTKVGEKSGGEEALKVFKKAVENCKPMLEVKTRRVGGANYQVPGGSPAEPTHVASVPLDHWQRAVASREGHA